MRKDLKPLLTRILWVFPRRRLTDLHNLVRRIRVLPPVPYTTDKYAPPALMLPESLVMEVMAAQKRKAESASIPHYNVPVQPPTPKTPIDPRKEFERLGVEAKNLVVDRKYKNAVVTFDGTSTTVAYNVPYDCNFNSCVSLVDLTCKNNHDADGNRISRPARVREWVPTAHACRKMASDIVKQAKADRKAGNVTRNTRIVDEYGPSVAAIAKALVQD